MLLIVSLNFSYMNTQTKSLLIVLICFISINCTAQKTHTTSQTILLDKIKGAWAGQTIGVTYGGPIEFRFNGTMVNDYQKIYWSDEYIKQTMLNNPGLYDDLYMDITFLEVMEKEGLHAPVTSHALAFANADYPLWHANQAARYNILHGIAPPLSGHWTNNPHADCIDFQIEADFAGIISPGIPNAAINLASPIGHIMNSGDGFYGGAFVSACYANAYLFNDINVIINNALQTIPKNSLYYKTIADVVKWHKQFPNDWKRTWFEVQKYYSQDIGCPDGIYKPFNIDATVNSAYVVIGLLYGNGDFSKTIDIATRCGQDADCNPSTAGGILGAMLGYSQIPAYWKKGLEVAEDIEFKYTHSSLNKLYAASLKLALEHLKENGANIMGDKIQIPIKPIEAIAYEQSFTSMQPTKRIEIQKVLKDTTTLSFEGNGFVLTGENSSWGNTDTTSLNMEIMLDGQLLETIDLPVAFKTRRHELAWKYQLPQGKHQLKLSIVQPNQKYECRLNDLIIYSDH